MSGEFNHCNLAKGVDSKVLALRAELAVLKLQLVNMHQASPDSHGFQDVACANFVANNPYSNTYNPGWKNHPNMSYKNTDNALNPLQGSYQPRPFQSQVQNQNFKPRAQGYQEYQPRGVSAPLPQQEGIDEIKSMLAQILQGQKGQHFELKSIRWDQEEAKKQMGKMQTQLKILDTQVAQLAKITSNRQGILPTKP